MEEAVLKFKLKPCDVLYFGSGKTLRIAQAVKSVFPPCPHTVAGAICSKLNSLNINKPLKKLFGPFLYNEKEKKFYFPKPADIYKLRKKETVEACFYVKPIKRNFSLFSLENINKPEGIELIALYQGAEEIEPFDGFISENGLFKWIKGEKIIKEDVKQFQEVFEYEPRLGIRQEITTHTVAGKDSVYRVSFVRIKEEWSFVVFVEFKDNIKEEVLKFFQTPPFIFKFGGEMKIIKYEMENKNIKEEKIFKEIERAKIGDIKEVKILYLTPGVYEKFPPLNEIEGVEIKGVLIPRWLNLSISSKKLGKINLVKKAFLPGTVLYGEVKDLEKFKRLWLNPSDGSNNFIGSNLIIYTKIE